MRSFPRQTITSLPHSGEIDFPDIDRDAETKTTCPTCKGSGKEEIKRVGSLSVYAFRVCPSCDGEGMVVASKAHRIRKASGTRKI